MVVSVKQHHLLETSTVEVVGAALAPLVFTSVPLVPVVAAKALLLFFFFFLAATTTNSKSYNACYATNDQSTEHFHWATVLTLFWSCLCHWSLCSGQPLNVGHERRVAARQAPVSVGSPPPWSEYGMLRLRVIFFVHHGMKLLTPSP